MGHNSWRQPREFQLTRSSSTAAAEEGEPGCCACCLLAALSCAAASPALLAVAGQGPARSIGAASALCCQTTLCWPPRMPRCRGTPSLLPGPVSPRAEWWEGEVPVPDDAVVINWVIQVGPLNSGWSGGIRLASTPVWAPACG